MLTALEILICLGKNTEYLQFTVNCVVENYFEFEISFA